MKTEYAVLFPYNLVEVLNGILFVALFWMLVFLICHLHRAMMSLRRVYGGRGGWWRTLRGMYRDYKPEIALFTITLAFCLRTWVLWYVRWLRNNDIVWSDVITENSGQLLIFLTGLLILGVVCWIRVISPFRGATAVVLWFAMVLSSVAFGVGMHYFF